MSANRIAAIVAVLTAVATGVIVPVLDVVPEKWKGPVIIAAMVCITVLAGIFMLGSQKFDSLILSGKPSVGPDTNETQVNVDTEKSTEQSTLKNLGDSVQVEQRTPEDTLLLQDEAERASRRSPEDVSLRPGADA